jgi:LAO/AO transport system kinase
MPAKPLKKRRRLSVDELAQGVLEGNRTLLSRAITLTESQRRDHRLQAQEVLSRIMPHTGKAARIGITGVPGVGKSTFIETFGTHLVRKGHRVAVLAVDPSSSVTGGSILGDKTRMAQLSMEANAYIRPSPSHGTLGGVAARTRETMLLCEAAGFDLILVETVGVGQSETIVADMTDIFVTLMLPGAGDELQGIKRGILELADLIVVNKADGDNLQRARSAVRDYRNALRFMKPVSPHWKPQVTRCSALENSGIEDVWNLIQEHRTAMTEAGALEAKRQTQRRHWMWEIIDAELRQALRSHPQVSEALPAIEEGLSRGTMPPAKGAHHILQAFGLKI